jgi:serine phosphatase RsbU (regulator of sigma subunit)
LKVNTPKKATLSISILTYEATIYYNESNFQKAIDLCDSVLKKIGQNNGYYLKALNLKAKSSAALNELNQSKTLLNSSIKIATKLNDEYNLSTALYLYGSVLSDEGKFTESNSCIYKSLHLKRKIADSIGAAACYAFLGLNFANMSDYSRGISFLHKSITIREKINDKRGLANSYLSLYKIYFDNGEKEKALKSELKSLTICQELNDYQCISGRLTNIGALYQEKNNLEKALAYQHKALEISHKFKMKNKIALIHHNIAKVYISKAKLDLAKMHIDTSIFLNKEIGLYDATISSELVLAEILIKQSKNEQAISLILNAIKEGEKLKSPTIKQQAHELASLAYSAINDDHNALYHYKFFVRLRDSTANAEKSKALTKKEFEYEYQKKTEIFNLKQKEKEKQIEQKSTLQKVITSISVFALVIVSILLLTTLKLNKQKLISKENLEKTNQILITKNQEILDSITYAKRIQSAILPKQKTIQKYLPKSFIIYKPKDIVAGDFYWFEVSDDLLFLAAADCTGHGVPGAMVSVICHNALNRSVKEFNLKMPHEILDKTREIVISEFEKSDEDVKDGMDISLCVFNLKENKLFWSGAHNPLWVLRNKEILEYKADKQPIGKFAHAKPFSLHEISIKTNDEFYFFTDGFQDQFGGEKGKKFKASQLRELLIQNISHSMNEKYSILNRTFDTWKGTLEQIDDVCIIGVKI